MGSVVSRGVSFRDWTKVKADWTVAALLGVDIRALFHTRYESIADFEKSVGIQMPEHIVAMLTPGKALEVIKGDGISDEETALPLSCTTYRHHVSHRA